ncbi:lipase [Coprinopsis cinerea AmutBmut pab1-1]|nr:lipase [Coprinopsis cinerea AmutBmut pab1-1]
MRPAFLSLCFAVLSQAWLGFASPVPVGELEARQSGIDSTTYGNLERFAKHSSAAYQLLGCPRPVGTTLVKYIDRSGTQGYISRDDSRKEIIVSFRGSMSVTDALVDLAIIMVPLKSTGITNVGDAHVHTGFQFAYNVVADDVISTVRNQYNSRSGYTIVVTGHSLGGAVASMAAISLKAALPNAPLKLYTYGQPRVGNAAFASLVESRVGVNNIFRTVHTYDGVPTVLFKALGYRHFATEYWNFQDPPNAANTRKCNGGDDPKCSDSIPSTFINPAHVYYFGEVMGLNPLLCL